MILHAHRYDFHRGIDIPTADQTPLYAIDDGEVVIAGLHRSYYDPLIQVLANKIQTDHNYNMIKLFLY